MNMFENELKDILVSNLRRPATCSSHTFTNPKLNSGYCRILQYLETRPNGESHRSICHNLYKKDPKYYGNYNGDTLRDMEYAGLILTTRGFCKLSNRIVNLYHLTTFGKQYLNAVYKCS